MIEIEAKMLPRLDPIEAENILFKDGELQVLPYEVIKAIDRTLILVLMHKHGIYVLPTQELIDFLKTEIIGNAIEIGCGLGAIGRTLGIPFTDSKMQLLPEIKAYYEAMGQPTINYPSDVIQMDALYAVKYYNPKTIIGAYITHKYNGIDGNMYGVIEGELLKKHRKYINVGNDKIHHGKPILKYPHRTLRFDWLVTRSEPDKNFIKIWG